MLRLCCAVFCMLVIVGNASSQSPISNAPTPSCHFSEVYRKDGWIIPGLEGAKTGGQRMVFKNLPGVYVTILEPTTSESAITDIWCSREYTGRIELEDQPIRILHLWTFDFGGRKFAYGLSYSIDAIENGKRIPVGAASAVIFYDVDGSGRLVEFVPESSNCDSSV